MRACKVGVPARKPQVTPSTLETFGCVGMMASQCAGSFTTFGQGWGPSRMPFGTLAVGVAPLDPLVEDVVEVGGRMTGELLLLQAVRNNMTRTSTAIAIKACDL